MSTKSTIALVTGGSRGLGRDMVINLARNGNNIIFTYHSNKVEADKVVAEVLAMGQKAIAYPLDMGSTKGFDGFVAQVSQHLQEHEGSPHFDFLINNAGAGVYGSVAETTEDAFDSMMNIHLKGVYFLTQKLLPLIKDGGRIVNISSGLTRVTFPNVSAYAIMKGAIETYTKCLAKELGSRNITVNVVAPGAIATDFGGGSNKSDANKRNAIASITALGRVGEPEDIGGVVAFLCTPAAGWMNGQRLELSGGMMV
ncbi:MAG: short-chain dehydrogenase [Flavobacterium sp. BFFFF1]|uniref:SDR family NAD(P)-dependent oxidoreductase n=1 Tax=Flavobacterium sp. BFFFF1 TaxID=2015557 RepID=UPI000BCA0959|nr:SDR family oxidoreductase [Flavobacterium sp. BFFFF1]OYU79904.1 MAG: short-chain dehydrogenase [Flavobacterium sp. BFFFF1]